MSPSPSALAPQSQDVKPNFMHESVPWTSPSPRQSLQEMGLPPSYQRRLSAVITHSRASTWQMDPEVVFTVQLNTHQKTVAVKGKPGAIEQEKEILMTFLDQITDVRGSAPSAKKAAVPKATVSVREVLAKGGF